MGFGLSISARSDDDPWEHSGGWNICQDEGGEGRGFILLKF